MRGDLRNRQNFPLARVARQLVALPGAKRASVKLHLFAMIHHAPPVRKLRRIAYIERISRSCACGAARWTSHAAQTSPGPGRRPRAAVRAVCPRHRLWLPAVPRVPSGNVSWEFNSGPS
jgi:hypothetical protein